jgi:hypothetical protein
VQMIVVGSGSGRPYNLLEALTDTRRPAAGSFCACCVGGSHHVHPRATFPKALYLIVKNNPAPAKFSIGGADSMDRTSVYGVDAVALPLS